MESQWVGGFALHWDGGRMQSPLVPFISTVLYIMFNYDLWDEFNPWLIMIHVVSFTVQDLRKWKSCISGETYLPSRSFLSHWFCLSFWKRLLNLHCQMVQQLQSFSHYQFQAVWNEKWCPQFIWKYNSMQIVVFWKEFFISEFVLSLEGSAACLRFMKQEHEKSD